MASKEGNSEQERLENDKENGNAPQQNEEGKKGKKQYGFRLTPEEQELAYELKAGTMRKLDTQNNRLKAEIRLIPKMKEIKKQNKQANKTQQDETLSRLNAIKLMRMYERKAKEAEKTIKRLESELAEVNDLARRYRDVYVEEKSTKGQQLNSDRSENGKQDKKETEKVTEEQLDDDEALFKRHVAKLAESKSMKATTPIRVTDVIRKNEVLILENESLKRDVQRLKTDNSQLIKQVKHYRAERDETLHHLGTSENNRKDLLMRLDKEQKKHRQLNRCLTRQASDWVQSKKESHFMEESQRWNTVGPVSVHGADERTYTHAAKKNIYMPRCMYPVEKYNRPSTVN